jgi:RsiW-degrading membrane proteinase PrsW (M82 family)
VDTRASRRRDLIYYLGVLVIIQATGIALIFQYRNVLRENPIGALLIAFILGTVAPILLGLAFYKWLSKKPTEPREEGNIGRTVHS